MTDGMYALSIFDKRDGPPKPWIGFNYTQQDAHLHIAERASIPATFAISSIFPALAIIAVILRFVSASISRAGRTADDWIIFAALFPTIASCVWIIATYIVDKDRIVKSFFKEAEKGNFTELDDPLGNANALQWGPGIVTTFYLTALALIKLSILLLYKRLFDTKSMRQIVRGGIVFVVAVWITFVVPSLLGLANVKGVSNGIVFVFILVFGCIDLASDVLLLVLPVPYVWRLQMSTARKLQVVCTFSLGAFCVISSTVRLVFLVDYWIKLQFIFAHELDWYASFTIASFARAWWMTWIWALIEPCTSIVAACLPTLRPLVDCMSRRRRRPAMHPGGKLGFNDSSFTSSSVGSDSNIDNIELANVDVRAEALHSGQGNLFAVKQSINTIGEEKTLDDKRHASKVRFNLDTARPDWSRSSRNLARSNTGAFRAARRGQIVEIPIGANSDWERGSSSPMHPEYRGMEWI